MIFNSLAFAVFLPLVFAAYWLCPDRWRWVVLLLSSYYFYMSWNASYVVLIAMTTLVSYAAARGIEMVIAAGCCWGVSGLFNRGLAALGFSSQTISQAPGGW